MPSCHPLTRTQLPRQPHARHCTSHSHSLTQSLARARPELGVLTLSRTEPVSREVRGRGRVRHTRRNLSNGRKHADHSRLRLLLSLPAYRRTALVPAAGRRVAQRNPDFRARHCELGRSSSSRCSCGGHTRGRRDCHTRRLRAALLAPARRISNYFGTAHRGRSGISGWSGRTRGWTCGWNHCRARGLWAALLAPSRRITRTPPGRSRVGMRDPD